MLEDDSAKSGTAGPDADSKPGIAPARPAKPTRRQEFLTIPRQYWLPALAYAGGALVFVIVDLVCYLASRIVHDPSSGFLRDLPH